jgi:hypothetical protein
MKEITKTQWMERFQFKPNAKPDVGFDADLAFYDNGSVKDLEGEFVVKCAQVRDTQLGKDFGT